MLLHHLPLLRGQYAKSPTWRLSIRGGVSTTKTNGRACKPRRHCRPCWTCTATTTCTWCYSGSTSNGYCQSYALSCTFPYPSEALVPSRCDDYVGAYTAAVWIYIVASVVPFLVIMTCICIVVCASCSIHLDLFQDAGH